MPQELVLEQQEIGAGRPDDAAESARARPGRTVPVNLIMGTSGMRTVNLPVEAVDGRTVREVINAAAAALRDGDVANQMFGEHALDMFADPNTAVHHILGPDRDQPLNRSQRIAVTAQEPLTFALYVDHVGGG